MPRDVANALAAAVQTGGIRLIESGVASLSEDRDMLCLALSSGERLSADQIILATGYQQTRPGGALIDSLIGESELPLAACGYPIVSPTLEWTSGLHVSGPLAELEIGPAARNIIGARMAGQRLIEF
jgi:hypothetical protein